MNFSSILTWIKNNLIISIIIGFVAVLLFFPKLWKGIFGGTTRRRRRYSMHSNNVHHAVTGHRRSPHARPSHKRTRRHIAMGKLRRPGMRKHKGAKKPWQIKGSLAAKRHMALIRKRK